MILVLWHAHAQVFIHALFLCACQNHFASLHTRLMQLVFLRAQIGWVLRPVPNVVLLLCPTQMKVSFRFKARQYHATFVTIRLSMAELGSAQLLCMAGLAVPHGSSRTWFQRVCYHCAELNS